jgi:hypothetical protein
MITSTIDTMSIISNAKPKGVVTERMQKQLGTGVSTEVGNLVMKGAKADPPSRSRPMTARPKNLFILASNS